MNNQENSEFSTSALLEQTTTTTATRDNQNKVATQVIRKWSLGDSGGECASNIKTILSTKAITEHGADNAVCQENEYLLLEIVTLNRALIAAREGNLKLLKASKGNLYVYNVHVYGVHQYSSSSFFHNCLTVSQS